MPAKRKFTEEQIQEICDLYKKGKIFVSEIALIYKVIPKTIKKCLDENGIKIKKGSVKKKEIKPGTKFGRWVVIEEAEQIGHDRFFLCECSCIDKTRKLVRIKELKSGKSQSCGCYNIEKIIERNLNSTKDYIGQIIGRLTILYEVERDKHGQRQVMAQCSCPDKIIKKYRLNSIIASQKRGSIPSCGCWVIERVKELCTYRVKDYQENHPLFCLVEEIMDNPDGLGVLFRCKKCNKWFLADYNQRSNRINAIERPEIMSIGTEYNFYCSPGCKNSCPVYKLKSDPFKTNLNIPTSTELAIWREEVLKRQRDEFGFNFCIICQDRCIDNLRAHHIDPKKLEPFFALDPDNGFVCCINCHDKLHKGTCSTAALANTICK